MRKTRTIVILCVVSFWMPLFTGVATGDEIGKLIHEENSLYHRIFVYQNGSVVTLQFSTYGSSQIQSRVNLNDMGQHKLEYTTLTFCGLLYKPEPKRVLVVGLGGGVIPRQMHHYFPNANIDVVEIDPAIELIASRFFGFHKDDKLKVHIDDGRIFVKKQLRSAPVPKYDLVILDAFNGDYIPFHLMTKEFLQEVKGVLANDGVVIANVFFSNRLFDAEFKTFLYVFGQCQAYFGVNSGNAMLVALGTNIPTLTTKDATNRAAELQAKHNFSFDLVTVAATLKFDAHPEPQAEMLTDDLAPVNWLRAQEKTKSP